MLFPLTANEDIYWSIIPLFTCVQVVPLFVVRKIPTFQIPAKILFPLTTRQRTILSGKSLLTLVQFPPLSVERYTPPFAEYDRSEEYTSELQSRQYLVC